MQEGLSPIGTVIRLPESLAEDETYFTLGDLKGAANFLDSEGYVVVRGLVPRGASERIRAAFDAELRHASTPILRQKNMRYERNSFDGSGFLDNPIFNIQDLETRRFREFKTASLDALTDPNVIGAVAALLGQPQGPVKLIQSMFFEAGVGTWAHQDSYYQDSAERLGGGIAGWFALEDIAAEAGRFFVCPRSHLMPVIRNEGPLDFAYGHDRYRRAVLDAARTRQFAFHAPFLAAGDVLFWNSCTVHGSLAAPEKSRHSRTSLTAHYLREGDEMLQFHARIRPQSLGRHNGVTVACLHDQDQRHNRAIRTIAARYPEAWGTLRRIAIRAVTGMAPRRRAALLSEAEMPRPAG
jgi:phytanoyl-CoA hydroxylase